MCLVLNIGLFTNGFNTDDYSLEEKFNTGKKVEKFLTLLSK